MSKFVRNEKKSREIILLRLLELKKRGYDWVKTRDVVQPFSPNGPWTEDLQNLVTEGAVECQDPIEEMGMNSMIRFSS